MVDAPYLTPEAARLRDPRLAGREDADIAREVAAFEPIAERYRGEAYTPRTETWFFDGVAGGCLMLPRYGITSVTEVKVDGTPVASTLWKLRRATDILTLSTGGVDSDIEVTWVRGRTETPELILGACTEYVVLRLKGLASGTSRNEIAPSAGQGGGAMVAKPDWSGPNQSALGGAVGSPTGYLEVDAKLNQMPDRRPGYGIA